MCYASYDPKYMMRDIEERLKGAAFQRDASEQPVPAGSRAASIRAFLAGILRKPAPRPAEQLR